MRRKVIRVLLSSVCLVLLPLAEAFAAGYEIVEEGSRIVEIRGMNDSENCASATTSGTVVKIERSRGAVVGFEFSDQYGVSYINVDDIPKSIDAKTRKRLVDGLSQLLVKGNRLRLDIHGCGAAGRIEKLVSVKLLQPAAAAGASPATARISGTLAYPSDYIPKDLQICAEHVGSKEITCTNKHVTTRRDTSYAIDVPPGSYRVFAQHTDRARSYPPQQPIDYRAYYSDFVVCGYQASCPSHTPIIVEAVAGKTATAEPGDWYAEYAPVAKAGQP